MMKLTTEQIKLAEQLLITVLKKESYVEYKELGDRVNPPIHHRQVPKHIGEISKLCYELSLPFLSAKVVTKGKNVAGIGFYNLYTEYFSEAKKLTPSQVFKEECKKIRECTEWYKLADYLHIEIDLPRPNKNIKIETDLSIRILPMSKKEEFPDMSIEDVQNDYFLGKLRNSRQGKYYFKKVGMDAPKGSLILFQFDNVIIASARLLSILRFNIPVEKQYLGAYKFDINTIKVFEPITIQEIRNIDKNITVFSQSKQKINLLYMSEIDALIQSKQLSITPDEIPVGIHQILKEGAKKQITVNSYERNYKARQACIEYYGCVCSVCGFDFGKFYGDEFKGKIHVHHIKSLSEINEEYEVDPIKDLRPVCPNCHLALHSKIGDKPYDIDELKAIIKGCKQ
ncbi:HNH endonuclease [Sedimentibacter sp. B4]|uniref:HNH endonuclease n=1 Tax=Sedimentibacter sp. B4 TaxID=304766 RepID=UPI0002D53961|nr:HNH endonuclease [Sedimentibacter sp. B4]